MDVAQLVEPWIVDPVVAGSIPVVHPTFMKAEARLPMEAGFSIICSAIWSLLLQLLELCLDSRKVRHHQGIVRDARVSYLAFLVDDEGGPLGDTVQRAECLVKGAVGGSDRLVEVADQGVLQTQLLFPLLEDEGVIDTDPDDLGVERLPLAESVTDRAELFMTWRAESEGEEEKQYVLLAHVVGELPGCFQGQGKLEIRGFIAYVQLRHFWSSLERSVSVR